MITKNKETTKMIVCLSDFHIPFHDEAAVFAAIRWINDCKPKAIYILGDLLDAYSLSRFEKDPRERSIAEEAEIAKDILAYIKRACKKVTLIDGNHEERILRYTSKYAPELMGIVKTIPELLDLDKLGIKHVPYGQVHVLNELVLKHGTRIATGAGQSVRKEMGIEGASVCMGHSHRLAVVYHSNRNHTIVGVENGHLSDQGKQKYLKASDGVADWQQGFSSWDKNSQGWYPILHRIYKGKVIS